MTEPESSLYDELGVAPDASDDALRAGYRRRARQLHPDVAADADQATGDAMRRLNQAWAVLGDPERRRRYDHSRAAASALPRAARPGPPPLGAEKPGPHFGERRATGRRLPFVRPSVLILLILGVIFVVTAYAGPGGPGSSGTPGSPVSTAATTRGAPGATSVVGQCLSTDGFGDVTVGPCKPPNSGLILAAAARAEECPVGTTVYIWRQHSTILCTVTPARPASP